MTVAKTPEHRLFDSHIFEPQSGAVFDATEGFDAYSHHLWSWFSVIGRPPSKSGNDPGSKSASVPLGWGSSFCLSVCPFQLNRQSFKHRPGPLDLESASQFFLGRSVAGTDRLHDRNRRHGRCGHWLHHDFGIANVSRLSLDVKNPRT